MGTGCSCQLLAHGKPAFQGRQRLRTEQGQPLPFALAPYRGQPRIEIDIDDIESRQLADTYAADATNLVLIAWPDAAPGRADSALGALFAQAFLFQVVRKNDVCMVAQSEVLADRDAGLLQVVDLFQEARRKNDHAIGDDGAEARPQDAGWQKREFIDESVANDGVAGIGAAIVADDQVVLFGEEIDDLTFGLVAPLQADDTGAGHSTYLVRIDPARQRGVLPFACAGRQHARLLPIHGRDTKNARDPTGSRAP